MDSTVRLNKILRELDITTSYAADILANKGHLIDLNPTTSILLSQAEILRKECKKQGITHSEVTDFEIGLHYDFEIKENRDNFTIVNIVGNTAYTYTSQRIYQPPGDVVKLFVKKFKDNGEPVLTFSVVNSYVLYENYSFDVSPSPRNNGYILENNEYHEHFVPPIFKSLIHDGSIKLKVAGIDSSNNKLIFDDSSLKEQHIHSSHGRTDLQNGQDYTFNVLGFKEDYNGEKNLVSLELNGEEYTTKALGFQLDYGLPKWIICTVNRDQNLKLYQNFIASFKKEFTPQKVYNFEIIDDKVDHNEAPYFVVKDKVGFIHRFYKNQIPLGTAPSIGDRVDLFIVKINEKSKHLRLDWYQKDIGVQRLFYSPEDIFNRIENYSYDSHLYALQDYVDGRLENIDEDGFKPPYLELFEQIERRNNNWFFSYLSLLTQFNNDLIKQKKYDKARDFINLYIQLEEWLIDSEFISGYSQSKKQDIVDNAEAIADKQEELLVLIDDLESNKHVNKLKKIYTRLSKHNIISKRDFEKTIQFLKWDSTLLKSNYELVYSVIHVLLDNKNIDIEEGDLNFLNQIISRAYASSYSSRNFVLTSGVQEFNEEDVEELFIENKHLFIQIRLNESLQLKQYAVMKSAEFVRNMALISPTLQQKKSFLLSSIDLVIKECSIGSLPMTCLTNLNQVQENVLQILEAKEKFKPKLFFYKKSGVLLTNNNGWLISNQISSFDKSLKPKDEIATILSLCDDRLKVVTTVDFASSYDGMNTSSTVFWGTFINKRLTLNDSYEELSDVILSKRYQYIRSVIKSLDYIVSLEESIERKIEALQAAKLMTVILRDNKSYYYDEMLRLYYRVNSLSQNIENEYFAQPVNAETLEKFPVLEKIQHIHSLINAIGKNNHDQVDYLIENATIDVKSIAKIVMAYNLIMDEFPEHQDMKHNLLELIQKKILNKVLFLDSPSLNLTEKYSVSKDARINEGREDIVTEFKTSIVYYPGSPEPEIDKQATQIVKVITGFLNARGGKLFIGIKDNGNVVGLDSDLRQLEVNIDGYERVLRKYIVKLTSVTVNGLLEFNFLKENNLEYLVIEIPTSNKLIDFKGDFYQRQGTETRLIKGQDLTSLFQQKLGSQPTINEELHIPNTQAELKFSPESSTVYDEDKVLVIANYRDQKGKYKLSIFDDRTWVWSDADKNFDFGAQFEFNIANRDSYLIICFSEGRLAKFRTRSFLSRNKNEKQHNTFALRPDSEIVSIFEIENDRDFLVKTSFSGATYLKIINSSEAGEVRNRLASQGTYFIDSNNDGVISIQPINLTEIINPQYSRLQMSKQTLGIESSSSKIKELVEELKQKNFLD
ncbi:hypothetical protein DCS32_03315 [Dokdonia sp. Dokd-P16]|uniref:AlbA family DNA-binding domain-containing protein n=1 Tax=Dokdonia sp. Dokd-P16 TaxID=2173169 RepID=UPI000D5437F4|nr:ATP-binding protein [Dokdonia sp. Dokd-P16]AWH73226.1 hypothetical protein DCS32_03315 [Dokdonia sp. Dokd-P16]